jgi:hypothetical protein
MDSNIDLSRIQRLGSNSSVLEDCVIDLSGSEKPDQISMREQDRLNCIVNAMVSGIVHGMKFLQSFGLIHGRGN